MLNSFSCYVLKGHKISWS